MPDLTWTQQTSPGGPLSEWVLSRGGRETGRIWWAWGRGGGWHWRSFDGRDTWLAGERGVTRAEAARGLREFVEGLVRTGAAGR